MILSQRMLNISLLPPNSALHLWDQIHVSSIPLNEGLILFYSSIIYSIPIRVQNTIIYQFTGMISCKFQNIT